MSLRLDGWVECRNPASSWFFAEWMAVLHLAPLAGVCGEANVRLILREYITCYDDEPAM